MAQRKSGFDFPKPAAQKTQQQQALTQAARTSTKQSKSKSKPVAAQAGRFWLLPRRPPKFLGLRRRRAHSNSRHSLCTNAGTKHQAEQEQAGSSSVRPSGWRVSLLLASGSWLHGLPRVPRRLAGRQNFWACGAIERWAMGVYRETTPPPSRLEELSRSSS
jgi:hypothetical protein